MKNNYGQTLIPNPLDLFINKINGSFLTLFYLYEF